MILLWILLLPLAGGVAAWFLDGRSRLASRASMAAALILDLLLLASLWVSNVQLADDAQWIVEWSASWAPSLGISLSFALDGLGLLLAILTCILGMVALSVSWNEESKPFGLHGFLMMSVLTSVLGVFLAEDLILFFVFYEVMLIPMFALIALGAHPNRIRAAIRFFMFTQAGGLLMLIALLALYTQHQRATGVYTFSYAELLGTTLDGRVGMLVLLGFFAAFAIKLPLVPVHTWQPDAYEAAPTGADILLAGLMAKAAGFGLLRFAVPLAPEAAARFAPAAMTLGVITILYAAWMAYGQTDLKRIIAYSSASHLGFVVLGAFSQNELAQRGAILLMFCHGISVAGLFMLSGIIERATGSRDIDRAGGLWHSAPRLGGMGLVFAMATLGLPGLGNFSGEFLVLLGTFQTQPNAAAFAALGAVLSAAYALRMVQSLFFGPRNPEVQVPDLSHAQLAVSAILAGILVTLGLFPQPFLQAARVGAATYSDEPVPARSAAIREASRERGDQAGEAAESERP